MDETTHPTLTASTREPAAAVLPPVWRSWLRGLLPFGAFAVVLEIILWLDDLRTPCEELGCLWPIIPVVLVGYALTFVYAPLGLALLAWERWGSRETARSVARRAVPVAWVLALVGPGLLMLFG